MLLSVLLAMETTKAEVLGLLFSLRELKKIRASLVCAEGDLKVVIGWGSGSCSGLLKYDHFIHEIREIVVSLNFCLAHMPRVQNSLVDKIAKWGRWALMIFIFLV